MERSKISDLHTIFGEADAKDPKPEKALFSALINETIAKDPSSKDSISQFKAL